MDFWQEQYVLQKQISDQYKEILLEYKQMADTYKAMLHAERSKREDAGQYLTAMRCSEHCGDTVRDK